MDVNATLLSKSPLKILEVASHFPSWGGTEIHVVNLSDVLIQRGHSVTISCRPGRFVEREAVRRGIPTFAATVVRQLDWGNALRYFQYLRRERFDVVHVHWRQDYVVPLLMAKWARIPVRLLSHHSPYPLNKKEVSWIPGRLAHRVIGLSESVRQTLIGCGVPSDRVITIHHGTDTEAFHKTIHPSSDFRTEQHIPTGRFVVGIAGRISKEKGHRFLLDAVALLTRRGVNVHLVVIGDGPDDAKLAVWMQEPDLMGRVTLTGFRSDVADVINALDVLVLASIWAEPCAAVIQQAMTLRKPVIGTCIGGTPEMIVDGETGLLVPPENVVALADAIDRLATMPTEERATLGDAGHERVERLFTQNVMADKIEALYRRELAHTNAALGVLQGTNI